jgi:SAM-dependent methyltransferase
MDEYEQKLRRESERWGEFAVEGGSRINWLSSPTIQRHINRLISGDEEQGWFKLCSDRFPTELKGGRGLSLGCNYGLLERQIVEAGFCNSFDAYDVSEESIRIAKHDAERAGLNIHYGVADVNNLELPREEYTLAVISMALHHFERLEFILDAIRDALVPGGFFVFNEYVGPTRFQWTDQQLALVNELRSCFPADLLVGINGGPASPVERPDIEKFAEAEPFEAIRSAEIMGLVEERFAIAAKRDYGGTILHMLFNEIIVNFDEERSEHRALINLACKLEEVLMRNGVIPSDFVVVVANPQ